MHGIRSHLSVAVSSQPPLFAIYAIYCLFLSHIEPFHKGRMAFRYTVGAVMDRIVFWVLAKSPVLTHRILVR